MSDIIKINKVHIMFEQSATFKNEFNKLGYNATTYDIENQFNKTDNVVDLFKEIENAYDNKSSIFDSISSDDMIVAFYPCTWFSVQNELIYSRKSYNFRTWNDEKIDKYISNRERERDIVYSILLKFIHVVKRKNIKTVIENPYTRNYLLYQKEMKQPDLIIENRRVLGDYFIKPTMFYFYNFEPTLFSDFIQGNNESLKIVSKESGINRSLMRGDFANNFIRKYILGK